MQPCIKLWIERDGRLVLSDYRVRLLELVRETGSLAQAAARMRLSYRRAWGKIKEIEQNLGVALVTSEAGERLVALYQEFQARMHRALAREFAAVFGALEGQRVSANGGKRGEP